MTPLDSVDTVPGLDTHTPGFALWLTLLQNHENKTVEMLLCFATETGRTRWVEAVTPCTASDDTDITRSSSRIKKNSRPALDMNIAPEG